MVKRSLIMALALLIAYNLFLLFSEDTGKYFPQNITQDNAIKVQEYLFRENKPEKVIVGSSLAAKLNQDLLENSYYNLAFRGQSIYDGFEIILSKNELPSQILIEYNNFLRSPQETNEDKHSLKYHLTFQLKKNLPSQREKNQPVNRVILFAYNMLDNFKNKGIHDGKENTVEADVKIVKANAKEDLATNDTVAADLSMVNIIDIERKSCSDIPSDSVVNDKIKLLKHYVSLFESKGIRITFFEMPIDPQLSDLERPQFIRNTIRKYFPPDTYEFIKPDDYSRYLTKDGIHLVDESAAQFTSYLMKYNQSHFNGSKNKVSI
jgi:hypothetical protein